MRITALKESLALFPVDELKAEQKVIIETIVARRDVFGKLRTGYGKKFNLSTVAQRIKLLERLRLRVPSQSVGCRYFTTAR